MAVSVACVFGCGDDDDGGGGVVTVDAGPDRSVVACEAVTLDGLVTGRPSSVAWEIDGIPILYVEWDEAGDAVFQAPAVADRTLLTFRLSAMDRDGAQMTDSAQVMVTPAASAEDLRIGLAPGCMPFRYGVASGDPRPDGAVIWTRVDPEADLVESDVEWEVATDARFSDVVASGREVTSAAQDFTVAVDVIGLEPATSYYYRFLAGDAVAMGRTKTAPAGAVERLRLAGASCSSIYSGYFNAYARIAERDDLDLVVHVGDYLYDFVDEEERVRVPEPFPVEPDDLDSWRARHAYYLTDPDLRMARATHPWFMMWDNHDVEARARPDFNGSVQAFREWNPIRELDPNRPEVLYRQLRYGELLDLIVVDILLHRDRDQVPGSDAFSILGDEQYEWLTGRLERSDADWRLIGTQKLFATVRVNPVLVEQFDGQRREVFDPNTWDGYPEDRSRVIDFFLDRGIDDNVFLTGDSHVSVAMDVVDDPANENDPYDPLTGDGSIGVEFLPTSISRGNFDEQLGLDTDPAVFEFLVDDTMPRNPHLEYLELVSHGYGILDITSERAVAEFWYTPIRSRSDEERLARSLTVERGANRWSREE